MRLLGPQAGTEPLEDLDRPLDGLVGGPLVPRKALHGPERQKGPGKLERVHPLRRVGLNGRLFEQLDRSLVITPRRQEKPSATGGEGTERRVSGCRALLE